MKTRTMLWTVAALAMAASNPGGYHVVKKIPVGGEGGWDCLTADSDARRLYVSHGGQVEVVDLDNGSVVGKIPDTPGVHGIALAPDLDRGFVSSGRSASVMAGVTPAWLSPPSKK